MPRPLRIRYDGAKYHVTARGNGRQQIFFGDEDYERFLDQLALAQEKDQVIVYAYCLMPNHYHLFVETPLGNIQRFEQRLNTAYGMYYRYKTVGRATVSKAGTAGSSLVATTMSSASAAIFT